MLSFCENIERNPDFQKHYHRKVRQLAEWYISTESKYSSMLKTELGLSKMADELKHSDVNENLLADLTGNLSYSISTKLAYFCVSDALVKLILSKYSFGPTRQFMEDYKLLFQPNFRDRQQQSWLNCTSDETVMAEIAAKVLADKEVNFSIDFQALATDRDVRSKLAHTTETSQCLSAMRCYNVIRNMLIFLDSEYADKLPAFTFEDMFGYDRFLAEPCCFNFDDYTTILIADSVHDVRIDYRSAVANLGWDIVIDLDGHSDVGGLLSSVSHNCIQKEVLYRAKANELLQIPYGKTLWYRCGEYQYYGFEPSDAFSIAPYIPFHKDRGNTNRTNNLKLILEQILKCAKSQDRAINIIAVTDDAFFVKQLISVIRSRNIALDNYFLSWIGLTGDVSRISDWFDDDPDELNLHFRHHQCPICQFYQAFAEYSGDWNPRTSLSSGFTLPGTNGPTPLREIERNNLEICFEALYDHCEEEPPSRTEELRLAFYRGNSAAWSVIASGAASALRKNADFENMKQRIRSILGLTQSDPQKRLFFIQHTAGIGGSTLARQLAWELHLDYAVLSARVYNSTIKNQLEHLYDVVLDKAPIIILAEDTLPGFDRLCADICRLNRRCVLIAACRQSNITIKGTYPNANFEPFNSIPNKLIAPLRNCYRLASPLPEAELKHKDQDFANVITGQMLTPFIIGLYYMEQDFNVDAYINKALNECTERRYADILACIALCDLYGRKNVPISFVNKALSLSQQPGFLRLVPAAASLISFERQNSNIDYYHFKHALLSMRFLELYCEKYYGGTDNLQNALYDSTLLLIDNMAAMGNSLQAAHLDILIYILIQNKQDESINQYLSALMLDIAMPENQKILMRRLAERFKPLADRILEEQSGDGVIYDRRDRQILRLVSHAYAHLGRMYSKIDNNYEKAFDEFSHAIEYKPDNDPNIYHMAGNTLLDKLKDIWNNHPDGPIPAELNSEIRSDVIQACEYFNCTSDFGSPEYGYPSKLELLFSYLRFIFRISNIHSISDIPQQDAFLNQLQIDFMNTLEEAKSYSDFDETTRARIADYGSRFQSQIMFGNFSKAIEYYQNQVDRLNGTSDISGLNNSLRGLAFAHIYAARANFPDLPFYRGVKNPTRLLEVIEILLNQPSRPERYSDYITRTQFFRYWMQLAKVLDCSIESGLSMVKRWLELESRNKQNKNPEPYYYMGLLLYLSARDGSSHALLELHQLSSEISHFDANGAFDIRRGSLHKVRDIIVIGKEMGQLFDVHYCRTEESIIATLAKEKRKPVVISGNFISTQYNYALLQIYDPTCWNGEVAWMDIGRNSQSAFTSAQIGHKIMFIMGFSVERPIALSRYVADVSTGETLNIDACMRKAGAGEDQPAIKFSGQIKNAIVPCQNPIKLDSGASAPLSSSKENDKRAILQKFDERPIPAGTVVDVVLDFADKDNAQGHVDGNKELVIAIKLKNASKRKLAMQAQRQKRTLKVRIIGVPKNQIYSGILI